MKIRNLLSIGIISSLLVTSCVNNDDFSEWNDGSQPITFSSYIKGLSTKAGDTSWAEGDEIGVFMKNTGSNLAEATRANCKFLTDGSGKMLAATNNDALYYPGEGIAVDFIAYYPYTKSLNGTTYNVNVADQSNFPAIDLLYANNAKNMSSGNPTLEFTHKLSKVVMNIETDPSIPSLDGLQVTFKGMNTKAEFNLSDGSFSNASASADINMQVNTIGAKAEAIVLPATLNNVKVVFSLGGYQTEAEINTTYESGKKYTYTVKLSHSGLKPSIQFGDATITDWTEVPGGDINVDFGDGSTVEPEPDDAISVTTDQPFTGLVDGQGNFTINNVKLPDGSTYVWQWDTYEKDGQILDQYMKASGYVGSPKDSESWLISPALDLSKIENATLTFEHTHKFAGTPANELTLWITETSAENWKQLTIDKYGTNNDYTFVTPSVDLTAYVGKTVKFAFKYVSSTSAAGTWEIKNVKVAAGEGGGTVDPDPTPGENLLKNPGFEDWTTTLPTAWDNATYNTGEIVKETSIKHGGNQSLRQTSASGTCKIQQEVAIEGGKKYRISYWFLDNDTKASSRYWFAMVGSDGKTINDINSEIQQTEYSTDSPEWQNIVIEFTAPAGTVKMRYEARTYRNMDTNEAGGYIYYDDMELIEIQ